MIQAIHTPATQIVQEKISSVAIQAAPYKVYANLEKIRESNEVHLEVIDGFLSKPESLAFSHAELLAGGIFCIYLSVIETSDYSTYYRSENMELPGLASSVMVKVQKNGKVQGLQHIDLENNILPC
jgi:hypothetical protein